MSNNGARELLKVITEGKTPVKKDPKGPTPLSMPAWHGSLTEQELEAVTEYLFSLMPEEVDDW